MPRPDTKGMSKKRAEKKLAPYFKSQAAEIDDLIIGPCYDEDRDDLIFSEFRKNGVLAAQEKRDGKMRVGHEGGVGEFLAACPHLDATRALTLLSEHPKNEAIERGKTMTMAPRGHVAKMVETILEDPVDKDFLKADEQYMKMERLRRDLGKSYTPEPILRVAVIRKALADAEDPNKVNEVYKPVDWEAFLIEEENRKAKAEKERSEKERADKENAEKDKAAQTNPKKRKHSSSSAATCNAKRAKRGGSEDGASTSGAHNSTEATSESTVNAAAKPKPTATNSKPKKTTQKSNSSKK